MVTRKIILENVNKENSTKDSLKESTTSSRNKESVSSSKPKTLDGYVKFYGKEKKESREDLLRSRSGVRTRASRYMNKLDNYYRRRESRGVSRYYENNTHRYCNVKQLTDLTQKEKETQILKKFEKGKKKPNSTTESTRDKEAAD